MHSNSFIFTTGNFFLNKYLKYWVAKVRDTQNFKLSFFPRIFYIGLQGVYGGPGP